VQLPVSCIAHGRARQAALPYCTSNAGPDPNQNRTDPTALFAVFCSHPVSSGSRIPRIPSPFLLSSRAHATGSPSAGGTRVQSCQCREETGDESTSWTGAANTSTSIISQPLLLQFGWLFTSWAELLGRTKITTTCSLIIALIQGSIRGSIMQRQHIRLRRATSALVDRG
jgi:hypothetical protein